MTRSDDARATALRAIGIMAAGGLDDFSSVISPEARNRESGPEPLAARGHGPAAFLASALWLRRAFADLEWEVEHVVVEDDLVVVETWQRGRHVGPFVLHDPDGGVATVWAPTGKTFAVRQSHWFRIDGGLIVDHWADRDDLGQAQQLGWIPPTPAYLIRCAMAKRREVREQRRAG